MKYSKVVPVFNRLWSRTATRCSAMARYTAPFVCILVHFAMGGTTPAAAYRNPYDAVEGCLLYDSVPGYNDTLEYLATDNFKHVGTTHNSKYIRVGMVGKSDGTLRFGPSSFPYERNVWEIYLAGLPGQKTEINRQTRSTDSEYINTLLRVTSTPNILSQTRPLMFRLEVFDNGNVHLTKDGERRPFLEFKDSTGKVEMNYIAFTQWNYDLFYFYDCPLDGESNSVDDTVLLRCRLA